MEGVRFVPGGKEGELIVEGALTVENAAEIKEAVHDALMSTDRLILTVGEDAGVDITFLQILCSAHRSADKADKLLALNISGDNNFSRVLSDSGFAGHDGCPHNRDGNCLWAGGGIHE